MFAISTLIKKSDGSYNFYNGALFSLPVELRDKPRLTRYLSINKPGWGIGEFGYQYYCKITNNSDSYIFPGLMILDGEKIKKKFTGY